LAQALKRSLFSGYFHFRRLTAMDALLGWYSALPLKKKLPASIFAAAVARVVLAWLMRKVQNRPPQPLTMPLIGNLYLLPQPGELPGVHKAMTKLSKKFGPVMGFWFGSTYTVVLSDWRAAHEALKVQGDAFAGRFCPPAINIITKGRGIALQNNLDEWRKARTALLRGMTMKRQGEKTVPIIIEEVQSTGKLWFDMVQANNGSADLKIRGHIGRESLNVYMRKMCNLRFSDALTETYEDVRVCLEQIFMRISAGNPADYIPILKLAGKPKVLDEMEHWTERMFKYISKWVQEHKASLDSDNPRDFLDEMLITQKENGLTDVDVEVIMWDVMAGGIDTTATTLEWLLYIMAEYPETQKKVQEELERVVGPNRLPTYEEKDKLPYLNAVILELMRWKHFAPFGLPHMTLQDTQCLGYNIPKGAQVLLNFHAINMDPTAWKDPEKWRPERFLEEEKDLQNAFFDGEVKKTAESYKYIPFGAGKRMCVGYGLGRVVMWHKVAYHLHCFNWASSAGKINIEDEYFGVTVLPVEASLRITARPAAKLLKSVETSFAGSTL